MLAGFEVPSWSAPLDAEACIRRTPEDIGVRGLFFQLLVNEAAAAGKAAGMAQYSSFVHYPMREYMRVAVDVAGVLFGDVPLRAALRDLGSRIYPAFKRNMAGAALFAAAGNDFSKVADLAGRAYSISITRGGVSTKLLGNKRVLVQLRGIYNFPDCLQVGVWEGALAACHCSGQVALRSLSECDVDFEIAWSQ